MIQRLAARIAELEAILGKPRKTSVVFRKVTNGFRSDWGAQIHAGYRSVTGTALERPPFRPDSWRNPEGLG
jgi:hypothetical protein